MTDQTPDPVNRALDRRKREDAAFLLPIIGVLLLCSPLLDVFAGEGEVFGVPLLFVYVFSVWLGLILLTAGLLRALTRTDGGG